MMSTRPRRLGKYELQEQLGRGSMAEVWKALDTQLQRYVAIKLLHANLQEDPHFIVRFEREAQLIASLHHPNIVQIHDFQIAFSEQEGTLAYMVMEYVEGQTLADYIGQTSRRGNIPSPAEVVQLFTSISLAIDYAHQQGMIHRDIKPANILLDKRNTTRNPMGEPILTDFGLAKLMATSAATFTATQPGTPLYASPEQANGYPGNERSDIYSLGVILYELVTGVLPFQADSPTAVMALHLNATPLPPTRINPRIPAALSMVIMRCLAKDPAARFPSASSLTTAIAEAVHIPVPESLGKPGYPADAINMPTYVTPQPSAEAPRVTPSSPELPLIKTSTPPPTSVSRSMPALTPSSSSEQSMPAVTSMGSNPETSTPAQPSYQQTPLTPSLSYPTAGGQLPTVGVSGGSSTPGTIPSSPAFPTPPPTPVQRRRRWLLPTLVALIVILLGSSLGAYFLFLGPGRNTLIAPPALLGHAYYVSSGQLADGAEGIADQLQVNLQNIPAPPQGKSYYLWLLADKDTRPVPDQLKPAPIHPPVLLTNNLPVQNSTANYTYQGDAQHNNLLSTTSRLLITLESAGRTPTQPSTDHTTWKYYAELPQALIPKDASGLNLRGLDHIRHIYYNEDHLNVYALYGGLDIWVFRNTAKLLEWATAARDDFDGTTKNYTEMHNLFISMLDYLDGTANVHLDVPPGTPITADPAIARVSLLTVDPATQSKDAATNPPGDMDHLPLHLSQLLRAPDITPEMRTLAQSILVALGHAKIWLQQVRMNAKQLFTMTPDQLTQDEARLLLDGLVTNATYAYIGQLNPATDTVTPGVLQAHYDAQRLATFDITANVPQSL